MEYTQATGLWPGALHAPTEWAVDRGGVRGSGRAMRTCA